MSTATKLGKVRCNPRGEWSAVQTYYFLDIVSNNGSSYMAIEDVPNGTAVSNTTYWMLIAAKGGTGEITDASASISGGYGTPGVTVTPGGTATERTFAFAFSNLRGNGLVSVTSEKTGTEGNVDTYTLTFTYDSGETDTVNFTVTNGSVTSVNGMTGDVIVPYDATIAPEYDDETAYKIGNLLTYLGKQYYCIADAPAGTPVTNTEYFEEKSVADIVEMIKNGSIVTGHSDVADNLTPYSEDSGTTQENPFISQGTGTDNNSVIVTTGVIARQLEKQGNTIVKAQLASRSTQNAAGGVNITYNSAKNMYYMSGTANTAGSSTSYISTLNPSHKYFVRFRRTKGEDDTYSSPPLLSYPGKDYGSGLESFEGVLTGKNTIYVFTSSGTIGAVADSQFYYDLFDITAWDSDIITDLTSHPEHFSWYYNGSLAYDAGSLQNCNGRYLECGQGRQLWDEVWELGRINIETGENTSATGIRSKNHIFVIPNRPIYVKSPESCFIVEYNANKQYVKYGNYFKDAVFTPSANTQYIRFYCTTITTYSNNITFSLYYSPAEGGEGYDQYYPYVAPIRIDTGNETLKAFDNKLPSGVIERNTASVNLGDLAWTNVTGTLYSATITIPAKFVSTDVMANMKCDKYMPSYTSYLSQRSGEIGIADVNEIRCNTGSASTPTGTLQYEIADSAKTTEQGTPFSEYAPINDYSYMAWFDTDGNLVSIPQGCKLFYPVDYKGFVDDLVMYTNGDATALAKNEDITDTALNARGYYKMQDLLTIFGMKDALGGALRHQLSDNDNALAFVDTDYDDLGSLTWEYNGERFGSNSLSSRIKPVNPTSVVAKILCTKYATNSTDLYQDKEISISTTGSILIKDSSYNNVDTFKASLNGVLLAYEKAST